MQTLHCNIFEVLQHITAQHVFHVKLFNYKTKSSLEYFITVVVIFMAQFGFSQTRENYKENGIRQSVGGLVNYTDRESIFVDPENIEEESSRSTFRFGSVDFLLSADYEVAYDGNISLTNGGSDDLVQTFSGGVNLIVVDPRIPRLTLQASYRPSYYVYLENDQFNNLANLVTASGSYNWQRSSLRIRSLYSNNQNPREDIGGQIEKDNFQTDLIWSLLISDKTEYQATLDYERQRIAGGRLGSTANLGQANGNDTFGHSQWLGYQIYPKLFLGPELAVRHSVTVLDQELLAEFIRLRTEYESSDKLSLRAFSGVQISQFDPGGQSTGFNYGGLITWVPFYKTVFEVNFSESQTASALINARSQTNRDIGLNLSQMLGSRTTISVNANYSQTEFENDGDRVDRSDDRFSTGLNGEYRFSNGFNTGVFYQFRTNDSTSERATFSKHLIGLNLGYQF